MSTIILRLSAPIQSWPGYRMSYRKTPTFPIPTKSGIAGLVGACLGVTDYRSLVPQFDLWARADKTNPFETDFQVSSATKHNEAVRFSRSITLANAKSTKAPKFLDGDGRVSERDFLTHTEFVCGLDVADSIVREWLVSFQNPAFMPYLGRRGNAPSFPFLLGMTEGDPQDVLKSLPRVPRHDEDKEDATNTVRLHHVLGDYNRHESQMTTVKPPTATRKEQLTWALQHLTR